MISRCDGPKLQLIIYMYDAKQKLSQALIYGTFVANKILFLLFLHSINPKH